MLEIVVIVYGIYTIATGKFTLTSAKKLEGWRGRVTGAILLSYLVFALLAGFVLTLTGTEEILESTLGRLGFTVGLLVVSVGLAFAVGHILYKGQEAEQVARRNMQTETFQQNTEYRPMDEDESPYRPPNH